MYYKKKKKNTHTHTLDYSFPSPLTEVFSFEHQNKYDLTLWNEL